MGTRGILGVRINGEDKLTYNHSDSYPSELGARLVDFCKIITSRRMWDDVKSQAVMLESAPSEDATPKQVKKYAKYADTTVSTKNPSEWYVLLRRTQGNIARILDAGIFINSNDFILDSLFCEYGYILNLDDMTLELYQGFQRIKHNAGRYSTTELPESFDYFPCALVGSYSLTDIPVNWAGCFKDVE